MLSQALRRLCGNNTIKSERPGWNASVPAKVRGKAEFVKARRIRGLAVSNVGLCRKRRLSKGY
jgi:hypothetical protein